MRLLFVSVSCSRLPRSGGPARNPAGRRHYAAGVLVVVAVGDADASDAIRRLRARGAETVEQRTLGRGRFLVYGGPFDDAAATAVASDLRAEGWPAATRPAGGGHLRAWQAHTEPVVIAERLWVCLPWSECDRSRAPGGVVEIDPGRAFGTGAHPSTRLLLNELALRLQGGEAVLDAGCGSGVLAVSAARLGATSVTAVDISQAALSATRANAVRNQCDGVVRVAQTGIAGVTGAFDVVVANMHAAPLVDLAPALTSRMGPRAWLGLSGLSPAQLSVVAAAYRPLRVVATPTEDDWAALILTV